jgi:hypothetical protein
MDLKKLDTVAGSNEGFELQLHDPATLAPLGIFIEVLGQDGAEFRKVQSEQNKQRIAKMTKSGVFRAGAATAGEMESDMVEVLAACTKSWRDETEEAEEAGTSDKITVGGEAIACTRAAAAKLYTDYPWIREQVAAAVTDRANFLRR